MREAGMGVTKIKSEQQDVSPTTAEGNARVA